MDCQTSTRSDTIGYNILARLKEIKQVYNTLHRRNRRYFEMRKINERETHNYRGGRWQR